MLKPQFIILYVTNPTQSGEFYEKLLGTKPVEGSPAFVRIPLTSDVMLGLWAKDHVKPRQENMTCASEINFIVTTKEELMAAYEDWKEKGLDLIQDMTELYFGTTFTATDPDGHRLRVLLPNPNPQP